MRAVYSVLNINKYYFYYDDTQKKAKKETVGQGTLKKIPSPSINMIVIFSNSLSN